MIRQPITRTARKTKAEVAKRTLGRIDLPSSLVDNVCPICSYRGRFLSRGAVTGTRRRAQCPRCGALERHRIQKLVFEQLAHEGSLRGRLLEVAPESFSHLSLHPYVDTVHTTDLERSDVSLRTDLTALPFPDASFDVVVASHVLEHIPDDRAAIAELSRVLTADGVAVLPVPMVNETTVEYPAPNHFEDYHVRAPGPDYYDRYLASFGSVRRFTSANFDPVHQVQLLEDRTIFPNERFPHRQSAGGDAHGDVVAIAYKATAYETVSATAEPIDD